MLTLVLCRSQLPQDARAEQEAWSKRARLEPRDVVRKIGPMPAGSLAVPRVDRPVKTGSKMARENAAEVRAAIAAGEDRYLRI